MIISILNIFYKYEIIKICTIALIEMNSSSLKYTEFMYKNS